MRLAALLVLVAASAQAQTLQFTVNPSKIAHHIDRNLYGQSLGSDLHDATTGAPTPILRWIVPATWKRDPLPLTEFFKLAQSLTAEPVLVVPARDTAAELLEYCNGPKESTWGKVRAQNGHPEPYKVKYWELDYMAAKLPFAQFTDLLSRLTPALKKIDPAISIIATASSPYTTALIEHSASLLDFVSLAGPEDSAQGMRDHLTGLIASSRNTKLKLFPSAWSATTRNWRGGISAAQLLNALERDRYVTMAASANIPIIRSVARLYQENFQPDLLASTGSTTLDAVATRNFAGDRIVVKVVNPLPKEVPVQINLNGDFPILSSTVKFATSDFLEAITFAVKDGTSSPAGTGVSLKVPRWSIAIITLSR